MLLENEFPPDDRVEKEALSLINSGYEVHLACYSRNDNFLKEENYKGIYIHRQKISWLMHKFSAAILILPFYFWFWGKFTRNLQKKFSYKAIHVHDLPLSKVGYYLKKKHKLKLICDQHEFYSNWIVYTAHYNTFLGKIVKLFSNWNSYEKKYLGKADLVITVEDPLREIYLKKYHLNPCKVISLPNTPLRRIFNVKKIDQNIVERYKNNFVLTYVGAIDILRGLDLAIKAMVEIKKEIPNVRMLLVGRTVKPYDPVFLAKQYKVEGLIDFIGWKNIEELPSYIFASDICFLTPPVHREEVNNTIATKIYQYIAMGKPIIVSSAELMKNFVESNQVGFALKNNNSKDFFDKVIQIYSNKEMARQMGEKGKELSESYFWEETSKPMIKKYVILLKK